MVFLKIDYYSMVHSNSENNNISLAVYYNISTIYRYEAIIQVRLYSIIMKRKLIYFLPASNSLSWERVGGTFYVEIISRKGNCSSDNCVSCIDVKCTTL